MNELCEIQQKYCTGYLLRNKVSSLAKKQSHGGKHKSRPHKEVSLRGRAGAKSGKFILTGGECINRVHHNVHVVCASQCACCVHHSVHNTVMSPLTLHLYLNDTCHSTGLGYSILLTTMNRFRFPILFLILHSTESSITRSVSIKKAGPKKDLFEFNNESGFYLKLKLLINLKLTVKREA